MKITVKDTNKVKFESLITGDVFEWNEAYYFKIKDMQYITENGTRSGIKNVIRLGDGHFDHFPNHVMVTPYNSCELS